MTLKGFNEYTTEDLDQTLPKGTYHLRVRETNVAVWDDGRDIMNVMTEVASGERQGDFGPRKTYWLGESSGVRADGTEFTVSEEKTHTDLIRDMRAIHDGREFILSAHDRFDQQMLNEIGKQIMGDEFIAAVSTDKNGYPRMGKISPMSAPPKGFAGAEVAKAWNLDEI